VNHATRTGQGGQAGPGGQGGQGVKTTLIEDDTEFKGTLSSKCPITVKGAVDGEIIGPSLHVSASGSVSGKVKVGELRSEGALAGEVDADAVHLAGTVKNDTIIRARSLEVRLVPPSGRLQVTFGQCELAVGDVPSKEEAVAAASAKPAPAKSARAGEGASEESPTQVRDAERPPAEGEPTSPQRPKNRRESSNAPTGA
jgi:cytoskeletal protein CcmA (bactofilin family)